MNRLMVQKSPLGRPIDPRYRSNILAAAGAALGALFFGLYNAIAESALASPWWVAGGAVFLAWAIARELDPDNSRTATIAMAFAAIGAAFAQPSLVFAFAALLGVRLISGTVGLELGPIDFLVLVGLAAFAGAGGVSVVAALAIAAALPVVGGRFRYPQAGIVIGAALAAFVVAGRAVFPVSPTVESVVAVLVVVLVSAWAMQVRPVRSVTDIGDKPLDRFRISLSRATAGAVLVVAIVVFGSDGLQVGAATLFAALLAAAMRLKIGKKSEPGAIVDVPA